jgi:hypothetical protein
MTNLSDADKKFEISADDVDLANWTAGMRFLRDLGLMWGGTYVRDTEKDDDSYVAGRPYSVLRIMARKTVDGRKKGCFVVSLGGPTFIGDDDSTGHVLMSVTHVNRHPMINQNTGLIKPSWSKIELPLTDLALIVSGWLKHHADEMDAEEDALTYATESE